MYARSYLVALFAALIFNIIGAFVSGQRIGLNCEQCIDRPSYRIKVIVHGTSNDMFWQRLRASSIQAGKDMRVDLDFELYDEFDPGSMAADITAAATGASPPDALIVSIPSSIVESAVSEATKYVPIFGMNSGYDLAERNGVLDFIAMDERLGGSIAAKEFLNENKNITKALFVNHNKGNSALDERLIGFREGLGMNASVDELVVDVTLSNDRAKESIASILEGCRYDAILLAGSDSTLEIALSVLKANKCLGVSPYLGTFDEGEQAYAAIATGKLLFSISQQAHLQGTLSVVAAAIYATTEKRLSSSQAIFGTYLSGPIAINFSNLPSDTLQICEEDAFPVCPNNYATDGITISSCNCLDRSKVKIAGVLHGITTDLFWDVVFAQARQAAYDLGVELKLDRLEPQPTSEILHSKMAQQIVSLCNEGVDGIFISIPSELVHPAIKQCQALNIPVISVNSGASYVESLGIVHHISQLEYEAGFQAGMKMAKEGVTEGICLPHVAFNDAVTDRCNGFEDGMKAVSPNITYLGNPVVPFDSNLVYIEKVEKIIGRQDDWDGIGALSIGPQTLFSLLEVKKLHPKLVVGTFDTSNEIYQELDAGTLLFGIDQNPFMQGYMPVWLLTIMAHTKLHLRNQYIETGPRFVEDAPSNALQICTANHFEVCPRPINSIDNQLTRIRPFGLAMAGISMFLSVALLTWISYYRKAAVVRKSQPLFLAMICVGTFLMAATIIPLSIDDSIASDETCTNACIATPWFLWIGFITTFSALFSKIYRIKKLLKDSEQFRRVKITAWDVMPTFCLLLALTLIFLLVWTVADPMYWQRQNVYASTDELSTFGSCGIGHTSISKAMFACLTILAFVCVILACVSAWYGRSVSVEYSESSYVGMVVIGMLQVFLLGIPLIALVNSNPPARYFVETAIIFVLTMSILLLIFIPKIIFLKQEKADRMKNAYKNSGRFRRSANGSIQVSSLRVMGRNQFICRDSEQVGASPFETTEIVSGITKKQVEDLRQSLIQIGTIDDMIDLQSLVEGIGIIISDGDLFPHPHNSGSKMSDVAEEEQEREERCGS